MAADDRAQGQAAIVGRFAQAACRACARRADCTKAKAAGQALTLAPRAEHSALQAARAHQQTAEFKADYARWAGVEGSFTQANRRCDLRHAWYIGLAKTHLEQVLTAVALNLLRVLAWLAEVPRAETRTSAFARLVAASTHRPKRTYSIMEAADVPLYPITGGTPSHARSQTADD